MRRNFYKFSLGVALLIGAVAILQILFSPIVGINTPEQNIAELEHIRAKLPGARVLWESYAINDYDIDVDGSIPLSCIFHVTLSIRNGDLATVTTREKDGGIWTPVDRTGCTTWTDFVVPQMFKTVEWAVGAMSPDITLNVSFDPKYGFVTEYRPLGFGAECCGEYHYSNFRVVTDTEVTP